jgi:alkaline phosphatase
VRTVICLSFKAKMRKGSPITAGHQHMKVTTFFLAGALAGVLCHCAQAQVIYPLDRAEILVGTRFDFKVELPQVVTRDQVTLTINGEDAGRVLGNAVALIEKEDGENRSSLLLRDASISKPGKYTVQATFGGRSSSVTWELFDTPRGRQAKNVILFIGDGLSVAHRTAARIMSKGLVEGRYGGELEMDSMPNMALVSTSGTDAVVTDSANAMSAYTTGHKSCVNALGVYCSRAKSTLDHPRVETIAELVKRKGNLAVGVVTNSEIEDATPAGMVAHTRRRSDYNDIVRMFHTVKPELIMGGGSPNFLPKSTPGSKRTDETNYVEAFKSDGYTFVSTATEMRAAAAEGRDRILGLYNTGNVDGAYDLKFKKGTTDRFPDQPDLAEQTRIAIDALSRNENGFVLMVESARIDKYSHSLDWERAVFDTILLDNAVKVAKDFAAKSNDTLVIVVPDHAHMVGIIGTYDDDLPGQTPRDKLGVYEKSKVPAYQADRNGYPEKVDLPQRLAFTFGSYPDHCFSARPSLAGEFVPAVAGAEKGTFVANEKNCVPGSVHVTGNLPLEANTGVHAADDVILTAMGPGADAFRGRIDNTRVFRAMVTALGLGQ